MIAPSLSETTKQFWGAPPPMAVGEMRIPHDFPPVPDPPTDREVTWWPLNPAQWAALHSPAQLLLFGGQSGGGKSDFLVGDVIWRGEHLLPTMRGLLLRETLGDVDQLGDRMRDVYQPLGARYRKRSGGGEWEFPSHAKVRFGYMRTESDLSRYRGNPRSWIGLDEGGLQPVKHIRTLIPWLSAVDPRLNVRMRITSNPGGVGHSWLMACFLRNRCPLHYPATASDDRPGETSVRAGYVYDHTAWSWPPDASNLTHMSTAFFPAAVTDNPLYGDEKIKRLLSQTPEVQMQLLHGCWCNAESLYFGFLRPEWMIAYAAIEDKWWWNHFISIDFGFMNSSAAAGRFSVDEAGRIFGTGELVEKRMGAVQFAEKVCNLWVKPPMGAERPRVLFVCMDPAMDAHSTTGKSIFEAMAEVFARHGVGAIKSHKSPADNAQMLYNGLTTRRLVMTDGMRRTFESLASRVVDERRAVKKIHGDPADDLYDMVSYAYNTWIQEAVKPDRIALSEKLEAMRERGADATDLARVTLMEQAKMAAKEAARAKGLQIGRRPRKSVSAPKR